jgi:methylaspartate mutase epsilon subunit
VDIRNKRLDDNDFARERKEVLASWPTGADVDLDEATAFHKSMSPHKNFAHRLLKARAEGATLIRSESGAPTAEKFTEYLLFLQNESHIDLFTMVDSMTRNQRYQAAGEGVSESLRTGKWVLNGFPMVSHGVKTVRFAEGPPVGPIRTIFLLRTVVFFTNGLLADATAEQALRMRISVSKKHGID